MRVEFAKIPSPNGNAGRSADQMKNFFRKPVFFRIIQHPPRMLTHIHHRLRHGCVALSLVAASCVAVFGTTTTEPSVALPAEPAISPDGQAIVFAWRGDLWSVGIDGGRATRLTSHPADDGQPMFSPDGEKLYFGSFREGARHLYSMPSHGGPVTRHSHHSDGLRPVAIHPDGTRAIVRALRDHPGYEGRRLFEIPLDDPRRGESLIVDIDVHSPSIHPDGRRMLVCRSGESPHRVGYRGSRASSIWLFDPGDQSFTAMVNEEVSAESPVWHPSGEAYFYISERCGTRNLWRHDLAADTHHQLTEFEGEGVREPALSLDGRVMVFTRGFGLWSWKPDGESAPREIDITYHRDDSMPRTEVVRINGTSQADFSKSGLEIVFAAEGRLFVMDTVLRQPNPVTTGPDRHEAPTFAPDGRSILAIRDTGTTRQLVRIEREDNGSYWWQARRFRRHIVTSHEHPVHGYKLAPDGTTIAFVDVHGTLAIVPIDGVEVPPRVVHQSWEPIDYEWSPDGAWMAISERNPDFNRDVSIICLNGSIEPYNLSRHPGPASMPKWSPDGRMIAFIGEPKPGERSVQVVHLSLEDHHRTYRDNQRDEAEKRMSKDPWYRDAADNSSSETADPDAADAPPADAPEAAAEAGVADEDADADADVVAELRPSTITIDFDELHERVVTLESGSGTPIRLVWSHDSKHLYFQTNSTSDEQVLRIEPHAGARRARFAGHRGLPLRIDDASTSYWIVNDAPAVLRGSSLTRYPISTEFLRSRRDHLKHGFQLAWRTIRDRFYDPALNHLDWEEVRLKYLPHAIDAATSAEFALVINRMLGELNASHLGFAPRTWPPASVDPSMRFHRTRHTGIRFTTDADGTIRVADVIPGTQAHIAKPAITPGMRLVSVDGRPATEHGCLARLFNGLMSENITVALAAPAGNDAADGEPVVHSHTLRPISFEEARELARNAEILATRRQVEEQSGGALGYIHIGRMHQQNFDEFQRQVFVAGHGREGLVIDIRDNRGGSIADHLLTILCQPSHAFTIPRRGTAGYPSYRTIYTTWDKPINVITNENSYSNAEIFAHAVQITGRGKVVGVPTGGGVISTLRTSLLDLGTINIPFRGWFHPFTGRDMELGPPTPDHPVDNQPSEVIAGIDRQLDVAIKVLTEEIRAADAHTPVRPVYRSQAAD